MATPDRFSSPVSPGSERVDDSPRNGVAVTASDSVDLVSVAKFLYVGVSGDVVATLASMADGTSITYKAHPVGYLKGQVKRVWSTGTTATNILAFN